MLTLSLPCVIIPGGPRFDSAADLAAYLREQITSGAIPPGRRLPSEVALMQTYGLARGTVSKAVRALRNEGLATYVRGYGVVVAEYGEKEPLTVEPGSSVMARPATPEEREQHQIPEGWPVLQVVHPDGSGDVYPAHRYRVITQ